MTVDKSEHAPRGLLQRVYEPTPDPIEELAEKIAVVAWSADTPPWSTWHERVTARVLPLLRADREQREREHEADHAVACVEVANRAALAEAALAAMTEERDRERQDRIDHQRDRARALAASEARVKELTGLLENVRLAVDTPGFSLFDAIGAVRFALALQPNPAPEEKVETPSEEACQRCGQLWCPSLMGGGCRNDDLALAPQPTPAPAREEARTTVFCSRCGRLIEFLADAGWLDIDGKAYCHGLAPFQRHAQPSPAPERDWQAVDPNVRRWIVNVLLHPMATRSYENWNTFNPTIKSEREFLDRQRAAIAAINLLMAGTGYALEVELQPERHAFVARYPGGETVCISLSMCGKPESDPVHEKETI